MVMPQEARERAVLDLLKERYEDEGYSFFIHPSPSIVPFFLDDYRPDAIAVGKDGGVVIEVKNRRSPSDSSSTWVAERFRDQKNWKFVVVYSDDVGAEATTLGVSSVDQIEKQINEAVHLVGDGHLRAAFLLAWGTLEAAARIAEPDNSLGRSRVRTPRQIVEFLEREGLVEFEAARELRTLINVRNALVHGDLSIEVSESQVRRLLLVLDSIVSDLRTDVARP